MTTPGNALVFDTGPMRHFAQHGWLGVLKFLAGDRPVLIPESVEAEIRRQTHDVPELHQVLDAAWISVDRSNDLQFLLAFAQYEQRLAVGEVNRGECGVLALGKVRKYELVLDDREARSVGDADNLQVTATLPLLCQAIREGLLTVPLVEALADDLIAGEYHLPFSAGGFRTWALQEALIDPD